MTNLLNTLNQRFNSEINLIQLALDGNWEQALRIEKEKIPLEISEVETFLQRKFRNIGFEVFFKDTENNRMFFGIRYLKNKKNMLGGCQFEGLQFVSKLCAALSPENQGLADLMSRISYELGGIPLLFGEPSHLEIGVVDFWKACGSAILWRQGELKQFSEAGIREKLKYNKQLLYAERNYQAIEFAFEGDYPHWLGLQIGERKNGLYETNISRLIGFSSELFGFENGAA